jgi:hypothetical protein
MMEDVGQIYGVDVRRSAQSAKALCNLHIGYYFWQNGGDVTVEPSAEPGLQTAPGPPQPSGRAMWSLPLIKTSGRLD